MALKLKGSTSGFVALDSPAVAGNNTITLPDSNGSANQVWANDNTAGVTTYTQVTINRNGDIVTPGTLSIGGTITYEDVTNVDSVGIITARTDIHLGDKLVHYGDTNTAIRFPSADTITAETAGTERFRITSGGQLYLGPYKTSTAGNNVPYEIRVAPYAWAQSQDIAAISMGNHSGATGNDDGEIVFKTGRNVNVDANGLTEKLRITSLGKVGISTGTIDPDGNQLLIRAASTVGTTKGHIMLTGDGATVDEGPQIVFSESGSGSNFAGAYIGHARKGTNSVGDLIFGTRSTGGDANTVPTERLRITSGGDVGIGTDTPTKDFELYRNGLVNAKIKGNVAGGLGAELILQNANAAANGYSEIQFQDAGTNVFSKIRGFNLTDGSNNGYMTFYTGSATGGLVERLRILSSGQVVIGTTIEGNSNADDLTVATSGTTGITVRSGSSNTGNIYFSDATSGSGEFAGAVEYSHSTNSLQLHSNSNEALRINDSRNAKFVGVVTATQFVPTEQRYGTKNLLINGSMQVAQRGTSHAGSGGFKTLDRFYSTNQVINVDLVTTQHALTSSDTGPWEEGFRYSLHQAQGYQGSVNANSYVTMGQRIEAQDIARSGWNYLSSSSYLTLSFWVRSTTAQTYYGFLKTKDGTEKMYPFSFAISANTWTKITKNIPGDSGLTFDNNNAEGLDLNISAYWGTDFTDAGTSLNTWANWSSSGRTPVNTSTWFTTNGGSFEVTGVQLEVGPYATPYEHLSYAEELRACQRYYYLHGNNNTYSLQGTGMMGLNGSTVTGKIVVWFPTEMRTTPSAAFHTVNEFRNDTGLAANDSTFGAIWADATNENCAWCDFAGGSGSNFSESKSVMVYARVGSNGKMAFSAEL